MSYRPDIDGLRAIAVLLVVGYHAFPGKLPGGFIGVDVFFVISGFLISSILFENLHKGSFSLKDFYTRRIKRIFPALLFVLLSVYVLGWFVLLSDEFQSLGKHLAGGVGFVSNWMLWSETGYFDKVAETKPLLHLWSLAIEEQFYIFWPLLLWFSYKKKWKPLGVITSLMTASFFLNCYLTHQDPSAGFYSPFTRFWELLSGAVLARIAWSKEGSRSWLSSLGILLVVSGAFLIRKEFQFPGFWALLPVVGAWSIIAAGPQAWINRKVLSSPLLVWFGLISFPLYLWHWPLLSMAQIVEESFPITVIRVAAVLLSVFLSWLTYRWIETPIRFGKGIKNVVPALVCGVACVGVAGLITIWGEGFEGRLGPQQKELREIISNPERRVAGTDCGNHVNELQGLSFDGLCVISKDSPPTMLVVGDSHAIQYQDAFFKAFPDEAVLLIAQTSCLPFATEKLVTKDCEKKMNVVTEILNHHDSIKSVFLAGHWAYLISGEFGQTGINWRLPKEITQESAASFIKNAKKVLSAAARGSRRVTLLKDNPDLDFDIRSCFDIRPVRLTPKTLKRDCSMSQASFEKRAKPYDETMERLNSGFPRVKEFDPRPLFCDGEKCRASDGVRPYYFNGDHLNYEAAEKVIGALLVSDGYAGI
ncbi:MAG: acyltransferase [Proteobacteria bacterium]|nr:acyltransferase [Pseudomonadota bacterium]